MNRSIALLTALCAAWLAAACAREAEHHQPHSEDPEQHAHHVPQPADAVTPGASVYQLEGELTDQHGARVRLDVFSGHPVVVVMFYGSCRSACPRLVHDVQRIEAQLPDAAREQLRVLLVTFDPERDTEERLAVYARELELPAERWRLLRGDAAQARELAAVLGVRYRPIANGEFSHTMLISLLSAQGEIVQRIEGLGQPVEEFAAQVSALATR